MAIERLYKVKIIGLKNEKAKVLDFLHNKGFMHLLNSNICEDTDKLESCAPLKQIEGVSEGLLEVKWIVESLKPFISKNKTDYIFKDRSLKTALNDVSVLKKIIHTPLMKNIERLNVVNNQIIENINKKKLLEKIPFKSIDSKIISFDKQFTFLTLVEDHNLPLDENLPKYILKFKDKFSIIKDKNMLLIQGLKEDYEIINQIIKENDLSTVVIPETNRGIKNEIIFLNKETKTLIKEKETIVKTIKKIGAAHFTTAFKLNEELTIYHERYSTTTALCQSNETFLLSGFVSKSDTIILKKLSNVSKTHVIAEEVNDGPSKLKNIPYVNHFEFLTKMFGIPSYNKVDPTIFLSFFIPLFFGFMFSDIGYGILLLICSVLLLSKSTKKLKILKDSGMVLLTCSITTILFGFLFGSFFGNLIKIQPLLFDPFKNAKIVLVAGLGLGLLHINLGIIISMYENIVSKDYKSLLLNNISIISLQIGILLLFLANSIGWAFFSFSIVLFLIKSSIMGIMEITGFVGTWFSYARLLALSLATGGIALGVNIMAEQLNKVSLLGPVLFIIMIFIGHIFNFTMNILGSSIHSVRLHYIEFFSQFYEGGGKPFETFTTQKVTDSL